MRFGFEQLLLVPQLIMITGGVFKHTPFFFNLKL